MSPQTDYYLSMMKEVHSNDKRSKSSVRMMSQGGGTPGTALTLGNSNSNFKTPGGYYNQQKVNLMTMASQKSAMLINHQRSTQDHASSTALAVGPGLSMTPHRNIKTAAAIPTAGSTINVSGNTSLQNNQSHSVVSGAFGPVKRRVGSTINKTNSNDYQFLSPTQFALSGAKVTGVFPNSVKGLGGPLSVATPLNQIPSQDPVTAAVSRNLLDSKFILAQSPTTGSNLGKLTKAPLPVRPYDSRTSNKKGVFTTANAEGAGPAT
jgi:hypothetical protein